MANGDATLGRFLAKWVNTILLIVIGLMITYMTTRASISDLTRLESNHVCDLTRLENSLKEHIQASAELYHMNSKLSQENGKQIGENSKHIAQLTGYIEAKLGKK